MTLFVVAIVLLVLIIRDQRRAIKAIRSTRRRRRPATKRAHLRGRRGQARLRRLRLGIGDAPAESGPPRPARTAHPQPGTGAGAATLAAHIASVERGRIAALGGVVNLIWLVILVLMVWQP